MKKSKFTSFLEGNYKVKIGHQNLCDMVELSFQNVSNNWEQSYHLTVKRVAAITVSARRGSQKRHFFLFLTYWRVQIGLKMAFSAIPRSVFQIHTRLVVNWDLETYKFCDEAFFRVDNLCRRNFDLVAWKSTIAKKIVLFLIKIFHLGDCKVWRQNGLIQLST